MGVNYGVTDVAPLGVVPSGLVFLMSLSNEEGKINTLTAN
jgi:hypothetical protein